MGAKITSSANVDYFAAIMPEGKHQAAVQQLEDITRPGTDGHSFRRTPARAEPFQVVMLFTSDGDTELRNLTANLQRLQGEIVKWTNARGQTYENLACLSVRVIKQHAPPLIVGGVDADTGDADPTHDRLLIMEFTLQQTVALPSA